MIKAMNLMVAAATIEFASNGAALAACEAFSVDVPAERRQVEYVDMDMNGKISPGDKQVGVDLLYGKDGREFGRLFFVSTFLDVDANGGVEKMTDNHIYSLPDGGIFAYGEIGGGHPMVGKPATPKAQDFKASVKIIGGTGGYTGALGTVDYAIIGGNATFDVNVRCE